MTETKRKTKLENQKNVMSILLGDETPKQTSPHEPMVVDIENLVPYFNHPFKLYEGERLDDMVRSIKELGVLLPAIVRPIDDYTFEILSGHNRVNAAKIAGLSEVPVIVKDGLNDDEAMLIVTESNLVQRSFGDLSHSERAISLKAHMAAISRQGKRNDLVSEVERLSNPDEIKLSGTSGQIVPKLESRDLAAEKYGLDARSVSRYKRLADLSKSLLDRVDNDEIPFIAAVTLSFINLDEQERLGKILSETSYKVDMKKAETLREQSARQHLTDEKITQILSGEFDKKKKASTTPKPLTIKPKIYSKYFDEGTPQSEMEVTNYYKSSVF